MSRQTPLTSDLANILRALVREEVDAYHRERGIAGVEYSTQHPASGVTSRTHNEACRSGRVEGARKEGRQWFCSREAWHRSRGKAPPPKLRLVPTEPDVDALTEKALAGARGKR